MILNVEHSTIYQYAEPVLRSVQVLRLTPFNHARQQVIRWQLETSGRLLKNIDWFGNVTHCLTLKNTTEIEVKAFGQVEVWPACPKYEMGQLPAEYFLRNTELTNFSPDMRLMLESLFPQNANNLRGIKLVSLEILQQLSAKILNLVPYIRGVTNPTTTAVAAFNLHAGVCQDHTHIFLACCRFLGIPARYVSGYLHTDDTSHLASHAWAEAWLGGAWYSYDISNQCAADEHHVELAYGLDYLDAGPIRGSRVGGGEELLNVISLVTNQ